MKKFASVLALLMVLSLSLSPFLVTHAEVTEDSWISKESMPTARSEHGVAVVNGKIYAIGGYNGTQLRLSINEEYDPLTDTWTTKTPMPTPRSSFGIAVYQNKIYVIGGANGTDPTTGSDILCSSNEVYDPLTDAWSTKASLPTPRRGLDAYVVDGKIYLIGGYRYISGKIQEFNTNEVYDPSTDTWTTETPLPTATSFYASAVLDNKIYVIGGPGRKINQIYDPETDTWSYGASAPVDVYGAAAGATTGVAAPKRIYVIGGGVPLFPSKANLVYNPERDAWSNCTYMPTARDGLGVAVVDDLLYAIGGLIFTGELAGTPVGAAEQYTPFGYGTVLPTISIVSPENKTYLVNNVSLTCTVSELTLWIRYSLDGQANVTVAGNTTLSGLSDGTHSLTVYASDLSGNTGSSGTVYFTIETTLPSITILSPENKTYDTTDVQLNFTVNESASWIGYSLDGQANVTIVENTTLTGLSLGKHSLTVYANDTAGNTGTSKTITFRVTEPFPTAWIATAIVITAAVAAALLVYFRKVRKTTGEIKEQDLGE